MTVYARRFFWGDVDPLDNTKLLDAFVEHPEFLSYPYPPDVARAIGASLVTDPDNLAWATYAKRELTGLVILTRVVPRVDALLHFMFLDRDLAGKRNLLKNILTHCFVDLGFHRISMEVPEGIRLERFARKVLHFKLEGEIRPRNPELPPCLNETWVAKQGSRRESAYFDGTAWKDVLLLRLLASEWVGTEEGGPACRFLQEQQPLPHPSPEPLPAPSLAGADPVTPSLSSPKTSSP